MTLTTYLTASPKAALVLAHGAGAGQTSPFMVRFARGHGPARHQRGDVRLPLHGRAAESAGPGAGARTVLARGARRRARPSSRACRSSSAASRWADAWRPTSRRRAARASTASCSSAIRCIRPASPSKRRDAHLPAIASGCSSSRARETPSARRPRSRRYCRRSSTPQLHEVAGGDHSFKVSGRKRRRARRDHGRRRGVDSAPSDSSLRLTSSAPCARAAPPPPRPNGTMVSDCSFLAMSTSVA